MNEKLISLLKENEIDLDNTDHPFTREFQNIRLLANNELLKCFEHLLLLYLLDIKKLKKNNPEASKDYLKKLKKKDISFWGERFELNWFSSLSYRLTDIVRDLKRGNPNFEADFVFNYRENRISIETTSVTYNQGSKRTNPKSKITSKIFEKNRKPYAAQDCILIVDISNLYFYGIIGKNIETLIRDLFNSLKTKFGAILLSHSYHISNDNNPRYINEVKKWINPSGGEFINEFLNQILTLNDSPKGDKIYFRNN